MDIYKENFKKFFGAVAFCTTKTYNFKSQPQKWKWPQNKDDQKNEDNPKKRDKFKKEDDLKNEDDLTYHCASTKTFVVLVKSKSSHDKLCSWWGIAGDEQMPKASQGWY